MKLAIRAFALVVVAAGISAASLSSSNAKVLPSHLSVTASLPIPNSVPSPGCGRRFGCVVSAPELVAEKKQ